MTKSCINLGELINLKLLKGIELITDNKNLKMPISRVDIMVDMDVLDCLAKDEILLIKTEIFRKMSESKQKDFIKFLKRKGVNAIVLKEDVDNIYESVIEYANEISFNILKVDNNVSFSDLMKKIWDRLFEENSMFANDLEKIHTDMMNLLLKNGNINVLIFYLKKKFNNNIIVKDNFYGGIINRKNKTKAWDFIKDYEEKSDSFDIKSYTVDGIKVYVIPIVANNSIYGNMFITDEISEITKRDIIILESITSILALEIIKRSSVSKYENNLVTEFFENIVSNNIESRNKGLDRAKFYGFREKYSYFCMRIELLDDVNKFDVSKVLEELEKATLEDSYIKIFSGTENSINAIIGHYNNYKRTAKKINRIMKKMEYNYFIGVGKQTKGYDELYKAYNTVNTVFQVKKMFKKSSILFYDELGFYKFLGNSSMKEDLLRYSDEVLKKLLDYEDKKGGELLRTLEVYLRLNGNMKKTGDELFTHYNTTLYRVSRIEEILGIDFDNEHQRLSIITALKIRELYR